MSDILYKYRSLENFKHFIDTILNNRLHATSYKDLNDPMEGMYQYWTAEFGQTLRDKLREEKGKFKICSLSRVNNDELMWSHYADGQKGIAIGVKIDISKYSVETVKYEGLPFIQSQDFSNQTAKEILCYKLEAWKYEQETRVFIRKKKYVDVHIEEIIMGRRISKIDANFIKSLIEKINPNIKIIKAKDIMKN
jgi:hypothetical protein